MTDDEISRLRALCSAATPGPWRFELGSFDKGGGHILTASPANESWTKSVMIVSHYFYRRDAEDLAFIAESRTAVPELLDEVERLRATLAVVNAGVMTSWSDLGSLSLQDGDVIDAEDVRLYESHVAAIGSAVDALRPHWAALRKLVP